MVRVGGLSYRLDARQSMGRRIDALTLQSTNEPIEASRRYVVGGWASVNEQTQGPPIWDVVAKYLQAHRTITLAPQASPLIGRVDLISRAGTPRRF
jgi:sulfur-oxidizing protein SoxB